MRSGTFAVQVRIAPAALQGAFDAMDIKHAAPPAALPSSWTIPDTVNMKNHGRKSNWTAQLPPYLRGLKIKNLIPSPKSPRSPKSPNSLLSPTSAARELMDESSFQIVHTPDRPERPISRTAIPNDEQCMQFLMSLQRQEENKRGAVKNLKMWPYPDEELEDRRCLRSVRVESVHLEEARLARTNSSGPARVVEVGRSSTKSTTATKRSGHLPSPSVSDAGDADVYELEDDSVEEISTDPKKTVGKEPLSPPPTLSRSHSRLDQHTPRAQMSRWSDDSESLFSTRDIDSPCPQRRTLRSSAEVSSPTMVDDDSAGPSTPSTPPLLTPVKDRPATPFTDPRLRSVSDPTTPPPSDHIVHQMSPESLPRKYSWRSSRETILNSGAPVSRFQSWLPESRPSSAEKEKEKPQEQQKQQKQQKQQEQKPELEVYGDWADYYFEDDNFWDEDSDGEEQDDDQDEDEEEEEVEKDKDADNKEANEESEDGKDDDNVDKGKQKTGHLEVDDGNVYPRYESFIKDYKNNVMNITVTEV